MTKIHTADDGWQFAEVEFKSTISESEFCICDACHKKDEVMKLTLPETAYHRNGNGQLRQLSTIHQEYWLCPPCRSKLVHALDWPEQTTKSDFEKQIEYES